jgi:hypothetical protein
MRHSTVFWDTRCLLTRFACPRSVGQATSRRSAGDASASTFRSDIVFWPRLREEATEARAGAKIPDDFCRGQARSENRPQRLMHSDQENLRARRRSAFGAHANLQSILIPNRSDAINSDHSLDASEFLRLSFGPWPRTRTIQSFFRFSCSNGSTARGTWPDFTSCRSNRRSSRIWRLCAAGVASGARGASGSTYTRFGGSRRSSSRNGSIARGAADTSSGPDGGDRLQDAGSSRDGSAPRKAVDSYRHPTFDDHYHILRLARGRDPARTQSRRMAVVDFGFKVGLAEFEK